MKEKYVFMIILVCISAAAAVHSFMFWIFPHIKEAMIKNAAEKYLEEVAEYAAENSVTITEFSKRELKLRQEKNVRCHEQLYFNENSGALAFFDYGWVSYSEPQNVSRVIFIHRNHSSDYIVTYTEIPLNDITDYRYEETAAENIYLYYNINQHQLMEDIYN